MRQAIAMVCAVSFSLGYAALGVALLLAAHSYIEAVSEDLVTYVTGVLGGVRPF